MEPSDNKEKLKLRVILRYAGVAFAVLGVFAIFTFGTIHKGRGLLGATIYEASRATSTLMAMPKEVKAVYITAPTAGNPIKVDEIIKFAHDAGMNAAVVNVKDGDGMYLDGEMEVLTKKLNDAGIYPIARIVTFQDNYLAEKWHDVALKTATGTIWSSRGYKWLDPASREVWDYNIETAVEALNEGFSEVNFDYIRFPADGDLTTIRYPIYDGKKPKKEVINEFASYATEQIKHAYPNAVISADIFAQGLITGDDQGIGQQFTDLAQRFDVLCPMTYPSHYAPGNFGFENPADAPYEIVKGTLEYGARRLGTASGTAIIRPWLQDFNMGAVYDKEKIQNEIRAVSDAGFVNGYMMWNPSNRYDISKYK